MGKILDLPQQPCSTIIDELAGLWIQYTSKQEIHITERGSKNIQNNLVRTCLAYTTVA